MKIRPLIALLFFTLSFCIEKDEDIIETDITFSEEGVTISKETVIVQGTEVVIENPGVYNIKGKTDQGNIIITKSSVTLNLDNLSLSSKKKAPIMISNDLTDIHINNKKTSVLRDLEDNETTDGGCSVIKIKKNSVVYFKNEGKLTLYGECKNIIKGAKQTSVIFQEADGEYNIESIKTAIDVDGQLEFNGGKFIINSQSDAIKSEPEDDDKKGLGKILINDGNFDIKCENDAFTAKNNITIKKGKFKIITANGYDSETYDEDDSAKGFKLTNNETNHEIKIYSGEFDLNCADDGFRSLRDITILSGEFTIRTKDDGICAKYNLVLGKKDAPSEDLKITILNSYEALEGMTVTIYSGKITCNAEDDGINASDPKKSPSRPRNNTMNRNNTNWNRNNTNWTMPGGGIWNMSNQNWTNFWNMTGRNRTRRNNSDPFGGGDWRARMGIIPNDDVIVRIYGGEINLYTDSDGIDANGHIYIHGGKLNIFSEGTGPNEPIDHDGNFTLFNSEILGVGTRGLEQVHIGIQKGNQMYAFYSGNIKKNQTLEIKDENDKYVNGGEITKDINYIFYTSSDLNEKYVFNLIDSTGKKDTLNVTFGNPKNGVDDEFKTKPEVKTPNYSNNLKTTILGILILLLI